MILMKAVLDELYLPYSSDLGFTQKEPPRNFKSCGFYLEPAPGMGTGYFWFYPAGDLYAVNIQHFVFKNDFALKYRHPAFLSIGCYINSMINITYDRSVPEAETLMGYVGNEGLYELDIKKNSPIYSIGISFLPDFYEKYLPQRFRVEPEEIKTILADLNDGITIPEVEIALKQIRSARPAPGTAALYYESRILEIISLMLQWKERRARAPQERPLPEWDLENLNRLHAHLSRNYPKQISLDELAGIACMSRSKLTAVFKRVYGLTITEYIRNLRMEKAKELLLNSDYDIGRVAAMAGYKRHASFSVLFRRGTGFTPAEFRARGTETS